MTNLLLAFLTIALMIADISLTAKILTKGGRELNPLMKWCMDKLGESWMMPKVIITMGIVAVLFTMPSSLPLTVVCVIHACIVLWNIKEYFKGE